MASAQHTERIGIGHAEIAEQVLLAPPPRLQRLEAPEQARGAPSPAVAALLRLFDEDASCAPLARVHGLASGHCRARGDGRRQRRGAGRPAARVHHLLRAR
ncbi:hypothetical protein [Pseudomonas paraeruginosa]|uniref:hypothetical protein n=1 Tax=Pseudomonas paraeruginosa TaxID=2994495 RepID=UPI000AC90462|nr:hypothetical protein [Pseudomonas paraeruginosa]